VGRQFGPRPQPNGEKPADQPKASQSQPSLAANTAWPAHTSGAPRERAQEKVTVPGSRAVAQQPAVVEATRCGGTGGYSMRNEQRRHRAR
jgi:hypothetical protein